VRRVERTVLGVEAGLEVVDELVHLVPGVGVDDARLDEAEDSGSRPTVNAALQLRQRSDFTSSDRTCHHQQPR
jgi:hypothetical protein